MTPALGYHRSPAPRAGGILAGLDAADVADLAAAYAEMAGARHHHPAEFVTACKRFQRLARALGVVPIHFERLAMLDIWHLDDAVHRIDRQLSERAVA